MTSIPRVCPIDLVDANDAITKAMVCVILSVGCFIQKIPCC